MKKEQGLKFNFRNREIGKKYFTICLEIENIFCKQENILTNMPGCFSIASAI